MAVLKYELRVIFGDTDAMGIVYYGNYFRYFERARSEWFRKFYLPPTKMIEDDNYFVVLQSHCNYIHPAIYEDVVVIEAWIPKAHVTRATVRFEFEIYRKGDRQLLVSGYTTHAFTGKDRKLKRVPKKFAEALENLAEDRQIENSL